MFLTSLRGWRNATPQDVLTGTTNGMHRHSSWQHADEHGWELSTIISTIAPQRPPGDPSTVIATVAMPRTENSANDNGTPECLIGRSARVLLPATGGGIIDQILRRVF